MRLRLFLGLCLGVLSLSVLSAPCHAGDAKIVLIPGRPSHAAGDHEFHAGLKLLAKCLSQMPGVQPVYLEPSDLVPGEGWPSDERVFEDARTLVFFMDGGGRHPMIQENRLQTLRKLMERGVGLVCMHYAVEVPKGEPGDRLLDWIGGYYESGYSTNPHWVAEVQSLPDHPITRGVKPFSVKDEWYYNIRFRPEMRGITPILVAKPDDATRQGRSSSPRGPYPHIVANKGRDEVLAWCVERPDGGRGFGFTGGHSHVNWGQPDFRKLVLNAILWTAQVEVPSQGVESVISEGDLAQNLDPKPPRR
jgi:type 1 glutamine amidotransferase